MALRVFSSRLWRPLLAASALVLIGQAAEAQVVETPSAPPAAVTATPTPTDDDSIATSDRDRVDSTAGPSIQAMPSFGSLFSQLPDDFRRMVGPQNLALIGVGSLGAAVGHAWDNRVARTPWGSEETYEPGQIIGSFLAQGGGALATYAVGRVTRSPRLAQVGSELFRSQVLAQATVQAIKFGAGRQRPDGTSHSFPSGHSAAAFASATVIQHEFGWKAGLPAFAVAGFVASSRVQMRRHYISDVVAGATVGILAGRSVTVGTGRARFSVDPMPMPGGLGVSFTRIQRK